MHAHAWKTRFCFTNNIYLIFKFELFRIKIRIKKLLRLLSEKRRVLKRCVEILRIFVFFFLHSDNSLVNFITIVDAIWVRENGATARFNRKRHRPGWPSG